MLSFVVPAHNEEALIGRTLGSLNTTSRILGQAYEIIVVDDASTDKTAEIASERGARVISVNLRQIAAARNAGARAAKGDRLVFVDADTVVTEEVVRAAVEAFEEGVSGGGCRVEFDGPMPRYAAVLMPVFTRLYRLSGFAAGCFLFCTRAAFEAVGGFDESVYASEEVWMSLALKRQGRFVVLHESVTTSARKLRTHSAGEMLSQLGRVIRGGRAVLQTREDLSLWYGERRDERDLARAASDQSAGSY
jgi:glycosyltransferase involved in cell wall biosynthesis